MNKVETLTTYHENVRSIKAMLLLKSKLIQKHFECTKKEGLIEYWENPGTQELVIIELI